MDAAAQPPQLDEPRSAASSRVRRGGLVLTAAALLFIGALGLLTIALHDRQPPTGRTITFEIPATGTTVSMAVSLNGTVAYTAPRSGTTVNVLWVRRLDAVTAQELPGTEHAGIPDWSPDGGFLVFNSEQDRQLKKIDVNSGLVKTLTPLVTGAYQRATWSPAGVIVFSNGGHLRRVSADGGEAKDITTVDASLGETFHSSPRFLPDGHRFLYTAWSDTPTKRGVYVGSLDSPSRTRIMQAEGGKTLYAAPGLLLFVRDGRTLMARRFDAEALVFIGEPVPIEEHVEYNAPSGASGFEVSANGALIIRHATAEGGATTDWVWFDRAGQRGGRLGSPSHANDVRLSPSGAFVASREIEAAGPRISIYNVARDFRTPVVADVATEFSPVWSADEASLFFGSLRGEQNAVFRAPWNRAGAALLIASAANGGLLLPRSFSPNGDVLVLQRDSAGAPPQGDLLVLALSTGQPPSAYLATPFDEREPALDSSGRMLAYVSNEYGAPDVFVQPFPQPDGRADQVSKKGGRYPRWRGDGAELYYVNSNRQLVAVSMSIDGPVKIGRDTVLFDAPFELGGRVDIPYDVTSDGQRFLMAVPRANSAISQAIATSNPITVIINRDWAAAVSH